MIAKLQSLGIGECTARGELPPRRRPWFYDNGAFGDWKKKRPFNLHRFLGDMRRIREEALAPDFIVVPDLVARGAESLAESLSWVDPLTGIAPLYLALQDGMDEASVQPHAERFDGFFVGGSTEWKLATGKRWVAFARLNKKPCHVGRVGTANRVRWAVEIGADSIDSCLPLWEERKLTLFLSELGLYEPEMPLFTAGGRA